MVYNATYEVGDFRNILLDIFAEFGVQTLGFISLIVIVIVITFLISRLRKR